MPLHVGERMRVEIEGNPYLRVSEHFGDDLGVDSLQEQECSSLVTQVMKPYAWKPSLLKKREEPALRQSRVM